MMPTAPEVANQLRSLVFTVCTKDYKSPIASDQRRRWPCGHQSSASAMTPLPQCPPGSMAAPVDLRAYAEQKCLLLRDRPP